MKKTTDELVKSILESYDKYEPTNQTGNENNLNRKVLIEIVDELRKLLFPGFFDDNKIRNDYRKFMVGERLEFIEYHLKEQTARALINSPKYADKTADERAEISGDLIYKFIERIPKIRDYLYTDVCAAYDGDPAAYSTDEIIFSYPGILAITIFRIAHELWLLGIPMIPRIMTEHAHSITGIDIHPGATIGKYFFIDHGTGIVIGETTTIGNNVKIYQGVTLGALSTRKGQELRSVKRHPTIGDNVTIYSGTTILGGETVIGDGVTIGGNAFIVDSVSAGTKVSVKNPDLRYVDGKGKEYKP